MKKTMLLGALMMLCIAAVGHAQESRQDVSISLFGVYSPPVYGLNVHPMTTTSTGGFLASYRYMMTPRSAMEANYTFAQDSMKYDNPSAACSNCQVNTRQQEISFAYMYMRTYGRFNPFAEGGAGVELFTPILDKGTNQFSTKQNMEPGLLFGGGLAYELSPSFDIRVEYRGFLMKTPDFGLSQFNTSRYYVLMTPSLGVAYHF